MTTILSYGQGGLVVTSLAVALAALGTSALRRPQRWMIGAAAICAALPLLADMALSTWYLFSPTYIDHIEASVASLTHYFMEGMPVYPSLDSYTFHGLLYGPLLPELNSLGSKLVGGVLGTKLVGWAAAWLAVALIPLVTPRAERSAAWVVSVAICYCVLVPFGYTLTADRADSLLLLFATLALWSAVRLQRTPLQQIVGLLLIGVAAGLATDLKLHAAAYAVPAAGLWMSQHREMPRTRLLMALAAAGGLTVVSAILPFLPANISAAQYLGYLKLGAKHGLSLELLTANAVFLLSLWVPAGLALLALRKERASVPPHTALFAGSLLVAELAVIVVAAKPGAGTHHLLPFLPFHCFLLQQWLTAGPMQRAVLPARRAALAGLAAVLIGTAWPAAATLRGMLIFDEQWAWQKASYEELTRFAADYPHGMVGIAARESYRLTILRPWITLRGTAQTDYGAWMDWSLSGVSDAPLADALESCRIPYLYMPVGGEPFTMDNSYDARPLFSAAVREGFAHSYSLVHAGQYFNVYGCAVALATSETHR